MAQRECLSRGDLALSLVGRVKWSNLTSRYRFIRWMSVCKFVPVDGERVMVEADSIDHAVSLAEGMLRITNAALLKINDEPDIMG